MSAVQPRAGAAGTGHILATLHPSRRAWYQQEALTWLSCIAAARDGPLCSPARVQCNVETAMCPEPRNFIALSNPQAVCPFHLLQSHALPPASTQRSCKCQRHPNLRAYFTVTCRFPCFSDACHIHPGRQLHSTAKPGLFFLTPLNPLMLSPAAPHSGAAHPAICVTLPTIPEAISYHPIAPFSCKDASGQINCHACVPQPLCPASSGTLPLLAEANLATTACWQPLHMHAPRALPRSPYHRSASCSMHKSPDVEECANYVLSIEGMQ